MSYPRALFGFTGRLDRAIRTLTSSPHGGWTQIQDPKATHHNGATYLVWTNGLTGDLEIGKYVHATGVTTTHVIAAAFEPGTLDSGIDNHSSPAVIVRTSDHKIVVVAMHHAETDGPYVFISSSAEDISAFGAAIRPDSSIGAAQYTYPVLYQMNDGTIWFFFRDYISGTTTGRLSYSTSTDGGATWSARTVVYTGATGKVPYWRIVSDGSLIHVFATDDVPTASPTGHFYIDSADGKCYTSAGVEITATKPFGYSSITQVHAATCWSWGASVDSLGRPACVLMVDVGSDNAIKVARWRSGSWQVDTVVSSVGGQLTGNQYGSGAAIHHANPDLVYLSKKATHWEMWRYVSGDDGATWTGTQLTSGSSVDNIWAELVHHSGVGLEGVWLVGSYTSDTSYLFGITGWG